MSDHGGGLYLFSPDAEISHNRITGVFAPSVGSAVFVDEGAVASLDHDLIYANANNQAGTARCRKSMLTVAMVSVRP